MKYWVLTFGCRTNQADSFELERSLVAQGAERAESIESADVVLVNTCAVTSIAEQAARQAIRRAARTNPAAQIIATGCYVSRDPSGVRSCLPTICTSGTDAILRNLQQHLPLSSSALSGVRSCFPTFCTSGTEDGVVPDVQNVGKQDLTPQTSGRTMRLLRVQTGCNEACSYCIVPRVRGSSRSTALADVEQSVAEAASVGFKEVMLTGVHLGSYGHDLSPACDLADLVERLATRFPRMYFRLSAVEPMDFDERLVGALARSERFAHYFHLPLQHASNVVLAAMKRPYTIEEYGARVDQLRGVFPDAALGADIMVGFPGETEGDFEQCARFLRDSPLTHMHVFPFSPRPGTPAATMSGRPHGSDVNRRVSELRAIGTAKTTEFKRRFVGTVREGLTIEDGTLVLTDNYIRVSVPAGSPRNERVRVRIVADGEPMRGVLTDGNSQG